jgi:ATP-dependent Clp protease adaptor protein ClpS
VPEYISTPGGDTAIQEETRVERPKKYKVLLHNDNYTTMEFVVEVLRDVFRKNIDEAVEIMLSVHKQGMGVAGVYVKSVAEAKVMATHQRARDAEYPLRCSMEPE